MKMRRQPGSVVHDYIEIVGSVDDSRDSAKNENEEAAEEIREEPAIRIEIRQLLPPTHPADTAIGARAMFHRSSHGESGGEARHGHEHREEGVYEFPRRADSRLRELMM